jgi:MFS family permease
MLVVYQVEETELMFGVLNLALLRFVSSLALALVLFPLVLAVQAEWTETWKQKLMAVVALVLAVVVVPVIVTVLGTVLGAELGEIEAELGEIVKRALERVVVVKQSLERVVVVKQELERVVMVKRPLERVVVIVVFAFGAIEVRFPAAVAEQEELK